jgi:hypothetical protein
VWWAPGHRHQDAARSNRKAKQCERRGVHRNGTRTAGPPRARRAGDRQLGARRFRDAAERPATSLRFGYLGQFPCPFALPSFGQADSVFELL